MQRVRAFKKPSYHPFDGIINQIGKIKGQQLVNLKIK